MVAREGVESSFLKGAKDLNRLKILKVLDSVGELDPARGGMGLALASCPLPLLQEGGRKGWVKM